MLTPNTRVNQLDATLLDQELFNNLLTQSLSIFNKIAPIYKTKYNNEIEFILRTLMFKYTVWDKSQSYGLFLQNLKFKNLTKLKKVAYYLVFIFGYYVSKKLSPLIYSDDDENQGPKGWKGRIWRLFKSGYIVGEKAYKVLSFLNFIDFLVTGKYQSLNLRLLNIKITVFSVELAKLNKGNISFEFQNRQLIWNTFLEFIVFTLPVFQNSKFQSIFQRILNGGTQNQENINNTRFNHLKQRQCSICFENKANEGIDFIITNPYVTNCGHLYCYVCILGKLENAKIVDEKWKCHRCGAEVEYAKPFDDVNERMVLFELQSDDEDQDEDNEKQFDEKDGESEEDQMNEKYRRSHLSEDDTYDDDEFEDYDNDELEGEFDDGFDEAMEM